MTKISELTEQAPSSGDAIPYVDGSAGETKKATVLSTVQIAAQAGAVSGSDLSAAGRALRDLVWADGADGMQFVDLETAAGFINDFGPREMSVVFDNTASRSLSDSEHWAAVIFNAAGDQTLDVDIGGPDGSITLVTKQGSGKLTISGAVSITGPTTLGPGDSALVWVEAQASDIRVARVGPPRPKVETVSASFTMADDHNDSVRDCDTDTAGANITVSVPDGLTPGTMLHLVAKGTGGDVVIQQSGTMVMRPASPQTLTQDKMATVLILGSASAIVVGGLA